MFKGVSQCMPSVGVLYFGPFNPFHYSPLPLYLPPIFQQLSIDILISSAITDVMFYFITDAPSFSFLFPLSPSSLEYMLQTCSTAEFVYGHVCFCIYVYHCIYLFKTEMYFHVFLVVLGTKCMIKSISYPI
jgi:hypothetical protein